MATTNPFETDSLNDSLYSKAYSALRDDSQYSPAQGTFDESKGVAGRVNSLTSEASPLWQKARTGAKQMAAKRGLGNSAMAAQAGEQAVIETATPIANADANLFQQMAVENLRAANQANLANAQSRTQIGLAGINADQRGSEFKTTADLQQQQITNQKDLAGRQLSETSRQFDLGRADNVDQFSRQLGQQADQFAKTQSQQMVLAQLDVQSRKDLAEIEAKYKNDIQGSANISNAWGTMMQGISAIQTNPELDENTKAVLIGNNIASFQAFTNFWKKTTGGNVDVTDLLSFTSVVAPQSQGGSGGAAGGDSVLPGTGGPSRDWWTESGGGE